MQLIHHTPTDARLADVLTLMRACFDYMDDVVDPPSSIHRLTLAGLRHQARTAEVWSLGTPPVAAVILTPKPHALYIGKLCVAPARRQQGLSRDLIAHAAARAQALNLPMLELETRIELTANHTAFIAMGFREIARTAHAGYSEMTAITFARPV